jgi:Domain of unknown function (DUF4349)
METPRNRDERLAEELRALRPEPRPEFAAKLDERAAAGFPRRTRLPRPGLPFDLSSLQPRRLALASGAMALLAIVAATALVATRESGGGPQSLAVKSSGKSSELDATAATLSTRKPMQAAVPAPGGGDSAGGVMNSGIEYEVDEPVTASGSGKAGAEVERFGNSLPEPRNRAVERSAELILGAEPGDVGEDSSEVFAAVHAHDGIVINSSTREGKPGQAGARFELLIPSAKLSDALAALSAIDEVRSRHEATTDITAPTVTTGELLRDSKARIDSLLSQLEEAETESEREVVETELQQERRHRANLRASLQNLQRRADLSRVLVRIVTGAAEEPSSGGTWGVSDALGDAGKILAVAAAVTVVGLAILGPIALIILLAWLTHRAWVRRERRRVLS